jgi:hypothetical protein
VYSVTLDQASHKAFFRAVFYDESKATAVNGPHFTKTVKLGLTDPDSSEVVPWVAPRFSGDFMLTSQGDLEQAGPDLRRQLSVKAAGPGRPGGSHGRPADSPPGLPSCHGENACAANAVPHGANHILPPQLLFAECLGGVIR